MKGDASTSHHPKSQTKPLWWTNVAFVVLSIFALGSGIGALWSTVSPDVVGTFRKNGTVTARHSSTIMSKGEVLVQHQSPPCSHSQPSANFEPTDAVNNGSKGESQEPQQAECRIEALINSTTANTNTSETDTFRVNLDSFRCLLLERDGVVTQQDQEPASSSVPFVHFEILECPPAYESSTFRLFASTENSHFMGSVGPRMAVKDECGIYMAKAPVVVESNTTTVTLHLHWTSRRRSYSNRISDVDWAYNAKKRKDEGNLTDKDMINLLGEDRLDFLQNHLVPIPGTPFHFRYNNSEDVVEHQHASSVTGGRDKLPDCVDIPISSWSPVGTYFQTDMNENLFASARCTFRNRGLQDLADNLRGMRIKYLQDSHGGAINTVWTTIMCPELTDTQFFELGYECPNRTSPFMFVYRFFRAVYSNSDFQTDFDGISVAMRRGSSSSCRQFLGLGLYNATIIAIPTWIYVYETREGWDDLISSMESLIHNCREKFPDLYSKHIVLIQTTTAVDSAPSTDILNDWRGIHNYNIEQMSALIQDRLGNLVDGIIPVFEMSYAKTEYRADGIHLTGTGYRDIAQVHAAAVMSAMNVRHMQNTLEDPRWFVGLPME
jgi:hypothetical protein